MSETQLERRTLWQIAIFSSVIALVASLIPFFIDFIRDETTPDYAICTEVFNDSTGWTKGGGHDAFCPSLGDNAISARGLGEKGVLVKTSAAGEEAKWGNKTLRIDRQYKYTCQIELQWRTTMTDDVNPSICIPEENSRKWLSLRNLLIGGIVFIVLVIVGLKRGSRKTA